MYRKAIERMRKWKENGAKRALLVTGARQIGKTWLVRHFGEASYANVAEINFVTDPDAARIFASRLDADTIITGLTAYLRKPLIPGETLIFLDEIQECPDARSAIKFLVEDGRFDYIMSGSLLGVQYKPVRSYPVGAEEILPMYPMDFEEFCIANGVQSETLQHVKESYEKRQVVNETVHQSMMELFRYYVIIGGMPAAVQEYIDTHDVARTVAVQRDILAMYRLDIGKYAGAQRTRVQDVFDRIPAELNHQNRRFQLASIRESARLREYEDAFLWLRDAGVAYPCYNITEPKPPLKLNEQSRLFKLFLNDSGLLCGATMEDIQFSVLSGDLQVNMGSILENVFATQFFSNGFQLRYFNRRSKGELDFCLQDGERILPVEIKSGKDYHLHNALNHVLDTTEWNLEEGFVFCMGQTEIRGRVVYYPWYMMMFFRHHDIL